MEKEQRKLAKTAKKPLVKESILEESDRENTVQDFNDENSDVACPYCNQLHSQSRLKESWIKCLNCKK